MVAREDGNNFNNRHFSSGGHQSHEAVLRAQYDQLSRPSELGEFAWTLLARLLPEELRDAAGERPAARAESTLAWLKSVAGKSDEELAWEYLRNSRATYQDEFSGSLAFLVEKGGPDTLASLREVFLDPGVWSGGSIDDVLAHVEKYVKRAPADPAFAEKLRAALKSGLDAEEAGHREFGRSESNMDRQFAARRKMEMKKLDQLFKPPQGVSEQLAEIIAMEEPEALASFTVAAQSLATRPLQEIEPAIFQAAAKAKPVMLKSQMLQLLLTTAMRGARGQAATGAVAPPAVPGEPATREAIQTLLRDETPVPNKYDPANAFSISDITSWSLLAIHDASAKQDGWQRLGTSFPELAKKWARTRANALASGQPVPPMPSAANLPAGRAVALVAELGALPAAQIPAALDTKTPDEQLAVLEHLAKATDWPAAIAEAHFTVRKVAGEQAANLGGAAWKGRRLDEKFAHEIQTAIEVSAAAGKFFAVRVSGGEPLAGVQISVLMPERNITPDDLSRYSLPGLTGRPVPAAIVFAGIQSQTDGAMREANDGFGIPIWKDAAVSRAWREEHGKPVSDPPKDENQTRRISSNPAPFEKRLRSFLSLDKDARGTFRVTISATGIAARDDGTPRFPDL